MSHNEITIKYTSLFSIIGKSKKMWVNKIMTRAIFKSQAGRISPAGSRFPFPGLDELF